MTASAEPAHFGPVFEQVAHGPRHHQWRSWFTECGQDGLSLAELQQFGWIVVASSSCALQTPLGALRMPQPTENRWTMRGAVPQLRYDLATPTSLYFASRALQSLGQAIVTWSVVRDGHWPADKSTETNIAYFALSLPQTPCLLWFSWKLYKRHVEQSWWCCSAAHTPLPVIVFNGPHYNIAFGVALLLNLGAVIFKFFNTYTRWLTPFIAQRMFFAQDITMLINDGIIVVIIANELVLVVVLVASTWLIRGSGWATDDVIDVVGGSSGNEVAAAEGV